MKQNLWFRIILLALSVCAVCVTACILPLQPEIYPLPPIGAAVGAFPPASSADSQERREAAPPPREHTSGPVSISRSTRPSPVPVPAESLPPESIAPESIAPESIAPESADGNPEEEPPTRPATPTRPTSRPDVPPPGSSVPASSTPTSSVPTSSTPTSSVPTSSTPTSSVPTSSTPTSSTPTSSTPTSSTPTSSTPTSSVPTSSTPTSSTPTSSTPTSSTPTSSTPTSSTPTSSEPTSSDDEKLHEENKELADALTDRYGINVKICVGDDAVSGRPLADNPTMVATTLAEIRLVLAQFPESFFENIRMLLVGSPPARRVGRSRITQEDENGEALLLIPCDGAPLYDELLNRLAGLSAEDFACSTPLDFSGMNPEGFTYGIPDMKFVYSPGNVTNGYFWSPSAQQSQAGELTELMKLLLTDGAPLRQLPLEAPLWGKLSFLCESAMEWRGSIDQNKTVRYFLYGEYSNGIFKGLAP